MPTFRVTYVTIERQDTYKDRPDGAKDLINSEIVYRKEATDTVEATTLDNAVQLVQFRETDGKPSREFTLGSARQV